MFVAFEGSPNAMMYPPILEDISEGEPVVTNSIPCPTEGPPMPTGAPTLNSHSFLPVSLSSAKITPEEIRGVFDGAPKSLYSYGLPVSVTWPEKTRPLVTSGDAQVGNSVGKVHLIFPDFISIAVTVPLPSPFLIASNAGTR